MRSRAFAAAALLLTSLSPAAASRAQESPPAPSEARNVRLCHGDTAATGCDTTPHSREPLDEHELTALVTDRDGAPVANVPVELREVGPAVFVSTGGNAVLTSTGSDGVARAVLTADDFGTSTVVAEISPPGSAGSFRGPDSDDDECEQPADPSGAPAAGNCVSQTLTLSWDDSPPPSACNDYLDNDDDGYVDLEDPGCLDEFDDDETPDPGFEPVRHPRRINMRFRDRAGEDLVISGRLRLVGENDTFRKCTRGQPVNVQRRVDGRWRTVESASTNRRGRYEVVVRDRPGSYRALAPKVTIVIEKRDTWHSCFRAAKAKTHHHRT